MRNNKGKRNWQGLGNKIWGRKEDKREVRQHRRPRVLKGSIKSTQPPNTVFASNQRLKTDYCRHTGATHDLAKSTLSWKAEKAWYKLAWEYDGENLN